MTNYDKMPAGREMDALVAEKVMGWRMMRGHWVPPEAAPETNILACPTSTYRYSTDIAAAWEVVERLKNSTPLGDVLVWWNAGTLSSYGQPGWEAQIRDFDGDCKERTIALSGLSATAPLAICRAALRAVTP